MKGNKLKGEITIETAIVFPIVMLMVLLLIYFSMFLHNIVKMKSYAYGAGCAYAEMEFKDFESNVEKKFQSIPLFITKVSAKCGESTNQYKITLQYTSISNIKWMEEFINKGNNSYEINVEKRMSRKIFGITSAIRDNVQKGGSDN